MRIYRGIYDIWEHLWRSYYMMRTHWRSCGFWDGRLDTTGFDWLFLFYEGAQWDKD